MRPLALLLCTWLVWLPPAVSAEAALRPYTASYRLLFDGDPVGNSFFRLELGPERGYRFEAYTLPADKGEKTRGHEILESSSGQLTEDGTPRPQIYYFSVFDRGETSLLEFRFDWEADRMVLRSKEEATGLELAADTQDRLSYLLALGQWLTAGDKETRFPIAQPGVTATAEFVRIETVTVEFEAGSFETVHLMRVDAGDAMRRELWLERRPPHRLIAMDRHEPNGVARMELISTQLEAADDTSDPDG